MSINKNIYDLMILQSIAETKLNRLIKNPDNDEEQQSIRFLENYVNNNKNINQDNISETDEISLLKQLQVSVGAIKSLDPNYNDYEGGAGENTKITPEQLDYILNKYEIVDYRGNDSTGFSATVFREIGTDKLIISFRSTEFEEDFFRDKSNAVTEITLQGTALGQTISMVHYIESLKLNGIITSETSIDITGFSLGSSLGSTFFKMYENELNINGLTSFNGPEAAKSKLKFTNNGSVEF